MRLRILLALAALVTLPLVAENAPAAQPFKLKKVADGLSSPVYVTTAPGDKRLFVVEQEGLIRTVRNGKVAAKPYADLRRFVVSGGEQGLLSVAFSPKFATTGKLYVYFTNKQGNEVVWELHARKGAASIRPGHRQLLEIPDTESNHNGGQLQFGPDGMLYIGDGDGGGGGDRHGAHGNGQNPGVLLGKLLRIDPSTRTGTLPYGIPKDNPFVGKAGCRPEIWALGLRNPWRFSFDRTTGDLWIGDVGQNNWEEVDHLKQGVGGINFGWNRYEGRHDFATDTPLAGGTLTSAGGRVQPQRRLQHHGRLRLSRTAYRGPQWPLRLRRLLLGQDVDARDLRRPPEERLERRQRRRRQGDHLVRAGRIRHAVRVLRPGTALPLRLALTLAPICAALVPGSAAAACTAGAVEAVGAANVHMAVELASGRLTARTAPSVAAPALRTFGPRTPEGVTRVFLVRKRVLGAGCSASWYLVDLPIRPNGVRGWVPAAGLKPYVVRWRLRIDLSERRLIAYEDGRERLRLTTPSAARARRRRRARSTCSSGSSCATPPVPTGRARSGSRASRRC